MYCLAFECNPVRFIFTLCRKGEKGKSSAFIWFLSRFSFEFCFFFLRWNMIEYACVEMSEGLVGCCSPQRIMIFFLCFSHTFLSMSTCLLWTIFHAFPISEHFFCCVSQEFKNTQRKFFLILTKLHSPVKWVPIYAFNSSTTPFDRYKSISNSFSCDWVWIVLYF